MFRRLLVFVLAGVIWIVGLALPPTVAVAEGSAATLDRTEDVSETPSRPLPQLGLPADAASAIAGLPYELDDIPDDATGAATVGGDWTQVPGLPVEVQVASATTDASSDVPSPAASPSVTPSEPAPSPSGSAPPSPEPSSGNEVVVSIGQPEDLAQGVMLLSVDVADGTSVGPSTAGSPSAEASPSGDPAATATATPSPSPPPSPSALPSPSSPGDTVEPHTDSVSAELVDVRVSYADFDRAFGAGWSDRLVVTADPACFAVTPELPECATGLRVESVNDAAADTLTFTTLAEAQMATIATEPAAPAAEASSPSPATDELVGTPTSLRAGGLAAVPAMQVAAGGSASLKVSTAVSTQSAGVMSVAGTSSGGAIYQVSAGAGNYAATPFLSSSEWQVGTGTGEFTYSYPFQLPESVGGATPNLGLRYSSGSVDAMTLLENGQASQAGLGWDISVGSISRSFAACSDDGHPNKGDLCWKTLTDGAIVNRYDLTLNGRSSLLVPINANTYRLQDDPGWRVQRIMNATPTADEPDNSGYNNEAFKVTTPDGTEYWFGWGRGTNSTFTVPVYGNNAGERCNKSALEDSWCQQTWMWNLDRVIDPSGNITRYSYGRETNYYSRWANTTTAYRTVYDRAGILSKVEYGYRTGGTPRQLVEVSTVDRCNPKLTDPAADCTGDAKAAPNKWPDTPGDLLCGSSGACTMATPTFFSTKRLNQVATKVVNGHGSNPVTLSVDTWSLTYTMPPISSVDTPDLWLDRVTRTGTDGSSQVSVPPVMFDGILKQNRVVVPSGQRPLKKFRLTSVRNETGGRIQVTYGHASGKTCDGTYVSTLNRWGSDRECFAQKYQEPGTTTSQWEWFHKYVVTEVALGDDAVGYRLGGPANSTSLGQLRVYDYEYNGTPAWRFADSPYLPTNEESWTDWRGYEQTVVHTRKTLNGQLVAGDESLSRVVRYRGMDGTKANPMGGVNNVNLTAIATPGQGVLPDQRGLSGETAESATLRPGGDLISRTFTGFDNLLTVAGQAPYNAWMAYTTKRVTTTATIKSDGTAGDDRVHRVDYTINDGGASHQGVLAGAVTQIEDNGKPGTDTDNVCTTISFRSNGTAWMRAPSLTSLHGSTCANVSSGNLVTSSKTFYDGEEANASAALTRGLATQVTQFAGGNNPVTKLSYDAYGRMLTSTTGNGGVTSIEYNPGGEPGAQGDLLTEIKTTSPWVATSNDIAGHNLVNSATFDPRRGNTLTVTDENDRITRLGYDPIGRLVTVQLPGNSGSPNSMEFSYSLSATQPSRIKTLVQRDGSSRDVSYTFADGWGRPVETHEPRPFNPGETSTNPDSRIVSVIGYDDRGLVRVRIPALANPNSDPNNEHWAYVVNPDPANVDRYATVEYDAAGRSTAVNEMTRGQVHATSATAYRGDHVISDPPGAGKQDTSLDWWGRAEQVDLIDGGAAGDSAAYSYTASGQLATIAKTLLNGNPVWRYYYDGAGRRTFSLDPDTGGSQTVYDANSNPVTSVTGSGLDNLAAPTAVTGVDARLVTDFDSLNRPTKRRDTTVATEKLLSTWTYDDTTVPNALGRATAATQAVASIAGTGGAEGTYTARVAGYDVTGNVTSATQSYPGYLTGEAGDASGSVSRAWSYGYNDLGQVTSTTYPAAGDLGARTVVRIPPRPTSTRRAALHTPRRRSTQRAPSTQPCHPLPRWPTTASGVSPS